MGRFGDTVKLLLTARMVLQITNSTATQSRAAPGVDSNGHREAKTGTHLKTRRTRQRETDSLTTVLKPSQPSHGETLEHSLVPAGLFNNGYAEKQHLMCSLHCEKGKTGLCKGGSFMSLTRLSWLPW